MRSLRNWMQARASCCRKKSLFRIVKTAHSPTSTGADHQPGAELQRRRSSGSAGQQRGGRRGHADEELLGERAGCSASSSRVLNRASRSIMHTAKTSATIQPTPAALQRPDVEHERGATPNETRSASESSSAPIRLVASSSRASRPSRASQQRGGADRGHAQLEPPAERELHRRQPGAQREHGDRVGQQPDARRG